MKSEKVGGDLAFDFVDAALVAATFEISIEPDADNLERHCFGNRAGADGDAVGIVVLFSHLRGPFVPAEAAAHAFDLVGNDGFAVAAAAEHDAVIGFAFCHRLSRRADEVGIVAGLGRVAAAIDDLVATVAQKLNDWRLEGETCVVGADGNCKGRFAHLKQRVKACCVDEGNTQSNEIRIALFTFK